MRDAVARGWSRALLLGVAVVGVDQAIKAIVESRLAEGERHEWLPFLAITNSRNDGAAFGLGGGAGAGIIVVTVLIIAAVLFFFSRSAGKGRYWLPTGLLLGGAVGNLIDRIAQGYVTDFIDLPRWPNFNIADISIVFGVLILLVLTWQEQET